MNDPIVETREHWTLCLNPGGRFTNELVIRPSETDCHGLWIADVGSQDDPARIANGLLMASAPDLHALVATMQSWLKHGIPDEQLLAAWRAQAETILRRAKRGGPR